MENNQVVTTVVPERPETILSGRAQADPARSAASRRHLLAVDDCRHGLAVRRRPGDPLPRTGHAALLAHVAATPAAPQDRPAARFRSSWMAVIVHGVEGLPVLVIVLAVILGLMN